MNSISKSFLIFACLSFLLAGQIFGKSLEYDRMNEDNDDMFEDDMKLAKHPLTRGFGLKYKTQRWPGGVVYYKISSVFSLSQKSLITSAMNLIKTKTNNCIKFIQRTNQQNYINIKKGSGCWSYVGRTGGSQDVSLGDGCLYKGTITHELMHAIGFMHEQNRPDRDNHVRINLANVISGMGHNFKKYTDNYITYGPYDYYSIMHYNSKAFSKNNQATIVPLKANIYLKPNYYKTDKEIMTSLDVHAVKTLYECDAVKTTAKPIKVTTAKPIKVTTAKPIKVTTVNPNRARFVLTNDLLSDVKVYYVTSKKQYFYKRIKPGKTYLQKTYRGHNWLVKTDCGNKKFVIGQGKFEKANVTINVSEL